MEETGELRLLGDGTEPWSYVTKEQHPDNPNAIDVDALFDASRDLFERARTKTQIARHKAEAGG